MSIFLETKRLLLKPPELADLENLVALRTDPEVMQYIGTGAVQTREQVIEFIENAGPYLKKYGLGFYSVFEKNTGHFVGQAGLFHLGFNVNQPDIELAYRLHKKYWHLGYATELAKALIDWGLHVFSLPKIVAMVHPENEPSRKVMEKCGMSYYGKIDFRGKPMPCYEIYKNQIDLNKIALLPATLEDYPIIRNMASYYGYDISEYMGWAQESDGTQSVKIDFLKYWKEKDTFPFIIKYQNELVGFVIVDKNVSDAANDFNIAQFFILRKFTGKGIGRHVALQCINQFRGNWEVYVMSGNEGAYRFWRKVIKEYTQHQFKEYTRQVGHSLRNIFEFNSLVEK